MKKSTRVGQWWRSFSSHTQVPITVDVGSHTTKIVVGQRVAWLQPTCLVWDPRTQTVVSVGSAAAALEGKLPPHVILSWPVSAGVVHDQEALVQYLRAVFRSLSELPHDFRLFDVLFPPRSTWVIGPDLSPVQQRIAEDSFKRASVSRVTMTSALAALGEAPLQAVVQLGDQTTHVGLVMGREVMAHHTLQFGGKMLTEAIMAEVQLRHQIVMSPFTAEQLKQRLGRVNIGTTGASVSAAVTISDKKDVVRGKDEHSFALNSVVVSSHTLSAAMEPLIVAFLEEVAQVLRGFPSSLVSAAQEQPVWLSGGGALLPGLVERAQASWKWPVRRSAQPQVDAVLGASR